MNMGIGIYMLHANGKLSSYYVSTFTMIVTCAVRKESSTASNASRIPGIFLCYFPL